MGENPWWHPGEADLDWDEPLPGVIELAPDYSAGLPLWGGDGSGHIAWQETKFPPRLLDRLAAWQQEFDANFHWDSGWRSAEIRDHWASQAQELAADVRAELGTRAEPFLVLIRGRLTTPHTTLYRLDTGHFPQCDLGRELVFKRYGQDAPGFAGRYGGWLSERYDDRPRSRYTAGGYG